MLLVDSITHTILSALFGRFEPKQWWLSTVLVATRLLMSCCTGFDCPEELLGLVRER